jgi:uncharacterized protein (TIGR02145 family)
MKSLKMLVSSLALLLSVTVVLLGCDGDNGTGGGGGGGGGGGSNGNKCGVDGTDKSCKTVKIGDQTWMAENLNRKMGNSKCYGDADSNCVKYGRLYDWETAIKACPNGWKLPDTADWQKLIDKAGGSSVAGTKLKSTSSWDNFFGSGLIVGTDDYGFSALPGGSSGGEAEYRGLFGCWWTATEYPQSCYDCKSAYMYLMAYAREDVTRFSRDQSGKYSVRCIKN